ncbi:MAG: NRDE family protein [Pelagibacteraceae bacterium]|jgi:uncharacterized protein with NRDE domain|nr:NRDE family protein [Pelagibacteraceae bacterium]MDP6784672.1 NRDE family protein [Alphaproteobacteria bacterium]MBO6466936.1 NRDE family protein [Pelagibacteraceae bacterium]MBO6467442.1 NRDE family protein [Pelagibacteraceae bacterium]MBO6470526.1 NRDE family protein [Pelagibacteraceae bacterium]|tara:strand:- start:190 stop:945 length:756 start_codon:yes stop_codon:yes gene_type:complete
MCTSIILFRKNNLWPVIIGTNRDEKLDRKSLFPNRHWKKKYPKIVGGKDLKKNGSWIGVNDFGITAIIHNRKHNKEFVKKKNSRGNIILETLRHSSIKKALNYISSIDKNNYNSFNLLVAAYNECYWIKHDIKVKNLLIKKLDEGLSVITDKDLNDRENKKINYYYKLFSDSKIPNPSNNDWNDWIKNLTNTQINQLKDNEKICFINEKINYGTRSSSLISLPNRQINNKNIVFKSTNSFPTKESYIDIIF